MINIMNEGLFKKFINITKNKRTSPLLVKSINLLTNKEIALDLGAGALNDSIYLVKKGFQSVIALDAEPSMENIAIEVNNPKIVPVINKFENYQFPENKFDLVNAQYSLFFIPQQNFQSVFVSMVKSLRQKGIFVGQLLGINDSWNDGRSNITFLEKEKIAQLFRENNFKIVSMIEKEFEGKTALGREKHWHVYDIVAIKN
jgi:tellurite methyltransferase